MQIVAQVGLTCANRMHNLSGIPVTQNLLPGYGWFPFMLLP